MTQTAAIAATRVPRVCSGSAVGALRVADPACVPAWDKQVSTLPGFTFFHSSLWSRVLTESYGHRPAYLLCAADNKELTGMLPILEVASPLTGRRGVALPFTDFSPLLAADANTAHRLLDQALVLGRERGWRYLELRGFPSVLADLKPSVSYAAHVLDLRAGSEALMKGIDHAARRALRKAQESGVEIELSQDAEALRPYFRLHCLTRKRHGLPPQSFRFFEEMGRWILTQGSGFVATARWLGQPVAAAVFVHAGRQVIYKYGASDEAFQGLRPNNLLFCHVIRECAEKGFESMHFGRTSLHNEGLCRFKRSLGAVEQPLHYLRYGFRRGSWVKSYDRANSPANLVFRRLPLSVLRGLGRLLYRHMS